MTRELVIEWVPGATIYNSRPATALSDPIRRAMIERLSHGPASVHRLTEPFDLSQQMISKHIAYLVRARL